MPVRCSIILGDSPIRVSFVGVAAALSRSGLVLLLTGSSVACVGGAGIDVGVAVPRAGGGDGPTGLLDLVDRLTGGLVARWCYDRHAARRRSHLFCAF